MSGPQREAPNTVTLVHSAILKERGASLLYTLLLPSTWHYHFTWTPAARMHKHALIAYTSLCCAVNGHPVALLAPWHLRYLRRHPALPTSPHKHNGCQ